jgi:hypothetical protein
MPGLAVPCDGLEQEREHGLGGRLEEGYSRGERHAGRGVEDDREKEVEERDASREHGMQPRLPLGHHNRRHPGIE